MYVVEDLKQDAEYVIKVAAVTDSGAGNIFKCAHLFIWL